MDSTFVRKQFSSLNHDWILFENAGGTQVPDQVIRHVSDFYQNFNVQPAYFYPKSQKSDEIQYDAHKFVAELLNAKSPEQIIFGPSATALNRIIANAFAYKWKAGNEIICTISDHEANISPWIFLEKFGLKVKFWNINTDTFELGLEELEQLLSDKTVLVAIPHISNVLGTENNIAKITKLVHEAGAWIFIDGVASVPHRSIDVQSYDVDFFVFSTYKYFGPHMAALYLKEDILNELGHVNHFFLENRTPKKFELGTTNLEGCAAILGVKEYLEKISENENTTSASPSDMLKKVMNKIHAYEIDLAWKLINGLNQNPRIRIIGLSDSTQRERRVPVISFIIGGENPELFTKKLAEYKIAIGYNHFYAYRLINYFGLMKKGGVLRASLVHYNTSEEIQRFLEALFQIVR